MQLPCTEMCVMFGHMVFEIHEQTDRQTDSSHTDRNTSHFSRGGGEVVIRRDK